VARIVVGSWVVRYPLGGNLSWALQYLVGFHRLGHDVYLVEKSGWPGSCFDPVKGVMSDDCSYGTRVVSELLDRFGLADRWCYVDSDDRYHGMSRQQVESVFASSDVFIDMGAHGSWDREAVSAGARVLIDGEPGFTQMKMDAGRAMHGASTYDHHFTTGRSIGTTHSPAPSAGRDWKWLYHPVNVDLFDVVPAPADAPFTTVMNWQSYEPFLYRGRSYGHKDQEFEAFLDLPRLTDEPLEVAVSGEDVPEDRLRASGWRVVDGHAVTRSYDSFIAYLSASRGEFSVCKEGYVRLSTGWFSDRSAVYLANGRPVILQDTGWSRYLPTGEGLFAVRSADEAAAAIHDVAGDHRRHSRAAREIAGEYLDAPKMLGRFLDEIGVG